MNSLWPTRSSGGGNSSGSGDGAATAKAASEAVETGAAAADASVGDNPSDTAVTDKPMVPDAPPPAIRPLLQRNQTPQPPLPHAPAPPLPVAAAAGTGNPISVPTSSNNGSGGVSDQQQQQQPQDSLSLAQLRRIVAEFPRTEPIAYDYVYTEMGPIEEEIDEWFMYNFWQWVRLNAANRSFHSAWGRLFEQNQRWEDVDEESRKKFVRVALDAMRSADCDRTARSEGIGTLVYIVLGRWTETVKKAGASLPRVDDGKVKSAATKAQLDAMKAGVQLLADCDGIPMVWDALRSAFEPFWADEVQQNLQVLGEELIHLMTIMFVTVQETLDDSDGMESVRSELLALNPSLVHFMLHATARLRWDEASMLPQTQVFLLFWKSILLVFGGTKEIAETKKATSEMQTDDNKEKEVITASPLDYHVFRQEITSKYPAYIPPRNPIPLEAEQTSILPQLANHPTRHSSAGILPPPPGQSGGASILHQPVHIATPAPSPPPSPGVGGKGGKKQNYQTNQNFPFMYPPLDGTSNSAGGKGGAGLQDLLVGRKWEGSDVPASILEAGKLFSERVRMTRATRQLWDERERFLKFERGWDGADDDILDELDLSSLTLEEKEELGLNKSVPGKQPDYGSPDLAVDYGPKEIDQRTRERLEAIESFYREALPHLQSLVIVLLKAIVAIASNLVAPPPPNGQQQQQAGGAANGLNNGRLNGGGPQAAGRGAQDGPNGNNGATRGDLTSPSGDDVDEARSREIAAKAVTGILIMLLKWLKISHVLKFEYLTQLLLDSNYLPLVLKLFALHDVQQVVESKTDRIEHSFFYFCGSRAGAIPNAGFLNPTGTEFSDMSEDDSIPPPIKRRRSPPPSGTAAAGTEAASVAAGPSSTSAPVPPTSNPTNTRPEVDELGYPVNPLPNEPITDFSRRNFFSLINYLRVMQKICKHKAHRNLLMVQYKSSNILRKSLKVPQQELRLYTLKIFKNQVPYCGRKWRQSNMRVITAVYLHCRPELRDEWLAGSDVDAEVEEALPLEQALRSLTHWFNVRRYPEKMGADVRAAMREEQDFFVRELDKVDWNWAEVVNGGLGGGMGMEGDDGGMNGMMMGGGGQGREWEESGW
ncbi:protein required for hyphal anastomosis [Apodospora peruviana]|uniref:Protein required for hyphal anastomosis n=1 Tax=Apodospora peruviana TaxID=516989 RepID=A0AAE0MAL1_9PEZI|nr:protein required for hyphal anastomosis [Apodospora peruviana]